MPSTEIDLADRIDTDIDQLVNQGEFVNREQAVEELLTLGLSAYGPAEESTDEPGEDVFNQHLDEQQDPAAMGDEPNDDRPF
jgi:Arc/MetJ-type ribon-helix-helix transcriptional regulator